MILAKLRLTVDLALENGKIYTIRGIVEANLAIDGDRVVKIAKAAGLPPASEKIDLEGCLVLPGLIDAHVHLRDQELSYKEDFFTGTAAAANGGVTLTIDMPNNKPVTMSLEALKERMRVAAEKSVVNVAFYSAFPERTEEMREIVRGGAKAFKLFMSQKIGGLDPTGEEALLNAFIEAERLKVPVSVHAEDETLLKEALLEVREKECDDMEAYLKVHSPKAETEAIRHIIKLAEKSGVHIHICHVSSAEGIRIISSAKDSGLPITCEVTPHHLLLSSTNLRRVGAIAITNPPVRSSEDIASLWTALQSGYIDILVSDHAPHTLDEKGGSSVWEAASGIPGLETLLPLMLTEVNKRRLSISTLVQMTSEKPAEIFGIKGRGRLIEEGYADLVVVDMKREYRIDSSKFYSKAKFSPFDGWMVKGKPVKTLVNGHLVMDEGEILAKPGDGRVIN